MARENPEKYPSRMGQKWTTQEVNQLLDEIQKGKTLNDISLSHQRTRGGISSQLRKMAYEYYEYEKKSLEEISRLTGLSTYTILKTVEKNCQSVTSSRKNEVLPILKEINNSLSQIRNYLAVSQSVQQPEINRLITQRLDELSQSLKQQKIPFT